MAQRMGISFAIERSTVRIPLDAQIFCIDMFERKISEIRAPNSKPNTFQWNDNLNRFTKLRRLSLVNCRIPTISQSVKLKSLAHLNLKGNRINHLLMG